MEYFTVVVFAKFIISKQECTLLLNDRPPN